MDYYTFIDFYKSLSSSEKQLIQKIQKCIDDNCSDIQINELFTKNDDWISLNEKFEIIHALLNTLKNKKINWIFWLILLVVMVIVVIVIVYILVR